MQAPEELGAGHVVVHGVEPRQAPRGHIRALCIRGMSFVQTPAIVVRFDGGESVGLKGTTKVGAV